MGDNAAGLRHNGNSTAIAREAFDSLLIEMRMLEPVEASTRMELFGESFSTPVMTAALSSLGNVHPGGMVELAKAAAAADAVMWAGIGDEQELKNIIATGAKTIKIIKPYADKNLIFEKLEQAERCGALAVGMDIDFFFGGKRNKGFAMTYPVSPKTLDDIGSFIRATKLPFILKGVLSERDAQKSLDIGAAGIVVSHHGGIVDYAVPPIKILPRIAKAVGKKIPIFLDCGVLKGSDVFKALALGATAVSVGKALMEGLSGGADGARKVLEDIREELQWIMNHTGSRDLGSIDPSVIWS
jgi:isopentenyl diphosphate isomerase/L-lactate dehydrogenase-like FMN-dependent dehydrogenase